MSLLQEEIVEREKDGEILLTMDGNGKIGLLGEDFSRNGKELMKMIESSNLHILNKSDKCEGKITRKNTKEENEVSAIDFILASENAEKWVSKVKIDEDELFKISGKNDSDHNTIFITVYVPSIEKIQIPKRTIWNIRASNEKWGQFIEKLIEHTPKATQIISDSSIPFDTRYKNYIQLLDSLLRQTIGRTTIKNNKKATL